MSSCAPGTEVVQHLFPVYIEHVVHFLSNEPWGLNLHLGCSRKDEQLLYELCNRQIQYQPRMSCSLSLCLSFF